MPTPPSFLSITRRHWLGLAAAAPLAACGGGGDDAGAIIEFSADSTTQRPGQRATLTARFSEGTGRIEPDIGAVRSGEAVRTPPLTAARSYRLVVSRPGRADSVRELPLQVGWRDRWQTLYLPFPLSMHAAAPTADGGLLLIGGSRGGTVVSQSVDRFDPTTGRFTPLGLMRSGRSECSALRLPDGRVLVVGGVQSLSTTAFAELIDPAAGSISDAGTLNQPRARHAAVALADGRVLMLGGLSRDSAELWDPATRRWRLLPSRLTHSREFASATLLADGRVLVLGGGTPSGVYQFAELFDPATELFLPLPLTGVPAQHRLYFHGAHRLADGSVLVLGGNLQGDDLTPLSRVMRIDVEAGHAFEMPPLALARTLVSSVLLAGDQVLLAAGQTGELPAGTAASFYGLAGQRAAAALPGPRAWHSTSVLPDGRVLVAGGEDADGHIATTACLYD